MALPTSLFPRNPREERGKRHRDCQLRVVFYCEHRLDNLDFTISDLAAMSNARNIVLAVGRESIAESGWTGFVHGINRSVVNNSEPCVWHVLPSVCELLESAFTSESRSFS